MKFSTTSSRRQSTWRCLVQSWLLVTLASGVTASTSGQTDRPSLPDVATVIRESQPKMVKIYGAGGLNRLEAYQSGILVSEDGLILTAWSYVLDSDAVTVMLNDGTRRQAKLLGFHPQLEIALLKIDVVTTDYFNLDAAVTATTGTRILAFSNLYGVATGNEPVSVQRGVVATISSLAARRGSILTAYQGPVLILDAITSNPGAAGGAVTDRRGRFIGLIGKELRSKQSGLWLNFAIPAMQLSSGIEAILAGRAAVTESPRALPTEPMSLELLGMTLVPNVVARTPPFVDRVEPGSVAQQAGIQPDDLIVELAGQVTASCSDVLSRLNTLDRDSELTLTLQRGQEFYTVKLRAH